MSDLIDRQAAIDVVRWWYKNMYGEDAEKWICESIEDLPSAQPDVPDSKVGKWIYYPEINALSCSACKRYVYHYEPYNFCPNCGAEMKGEKE